MSCWQDDASPVNAKLESTIARLLHDAESARRTGSTRTMYALCNAVLALDPDNRSAKAMLQGAAVRRQMTLLFCDIVGSTELADTRDPEEVTALLKLYRSTCARVIHRFDGWIDDHRGDGMLVLFGFPGVRESDARRGVSCALRMIEELRRCLPASRLAFAPEIQVRISVHTGLVVVGDVGITGATSNEAARLQEVAAGNTVVVSDTTHTLVEPFFETESLGLVQLRGVARPLEAYVVLREVARDRSVQMVDSTSFVGRRAEVQRIQTLWCRTKQVDTPLSDPGVAPRPTALLVTGPPGIGKSRLVSQAAFDLGIPHASCACSPLQENTSLHPFRFLLEAACGITDADDPRVRLAKVQARLEQDSGPATNVRFLAAALDIPLDLLPAQIDVDASVLRRLGLKAAATLVLSALPREPSMLFLDDLHWADQSTLDLLEVLLASPRADLLVVVAARDTSSLPMALRSLHRLGLQPLDDQAMAEMAALWPEGAGLPAEHREEAMRRSDGVPLFLEELLRTASVTSSGQVSLRAMRWTSYKIPQALRDPLLARLSLPQVDLDLVQAAATIGRDFDRALLARIVSVEPLTFSTRLSALFDAELLEETGNCIRFRHELIREIAYETQSRSTAVVRHNQIADHLLALQGEGSVQTASELAFHLEHANRYSEAVDVQLGLAQSDQAVGSHVQACRRLTSVLALVEKLPPGPGRLRTELSVRQLRSFSAVMTGGYAAPEAAEDYPRCVELCEQSQAASEVAASLIRTWSYYAFRGDLDAADRVSVATVSNLVRAGLHFPVEQLTQGVTGYFRGHYVEAAQLLHQFVRDGTMATPERPPAIWPLPNDPLAAVQAHLGAALQISGDGELSAAWFDRALRRCKDLEFPYAPFSRCYVTCLQAMARTLAGDHTAASALGLEVRDMAERHGFDMWQLAGGIHQLIGLVHSGDIALLPQLIGLVDVWRTQLGADVWTPYWLTEIGRAQGQSGDVDGALHSLNDALAVAKRTKSAFYAAETLRERACLRLSRGEAEAVAELETAGEVAARQGAALFGRRVALSMATMALS